MVDIIDPTPDPSVRKEVVCRHCGVRLSYIPRDIKVKRYTDIDGCSDAYNYIECPSCQTNITVKRHY